MIGGILAAGAVRHRIEARRRARWQRIAARLGLAFRTTLRAQLVLEGNRGDFRVRVEAAGAMAYRVTVHNGNRPLPRDLSLQPYGLASVIAGASRRDITVGDPAFDEQIVVTGHPAIARALLDGPTRALVARAVAAHGVRFEDCELSRVPGGTFDEVVERIGVMEALAPALARGFGRPVAELLVENVLGDPLPEVRRRCLEQLGEGPGESWRAAAEAALRDSDPYVRLLAGTQLGRAGWATLESLVLDAGVSETVRIEAARELLSQADESERRGIAARLLALVPGIVARVDPSLRAELAGRMTLSAPAGGELSTAAAPGAIGLADGAGIPAARK